MFPWVSTFSFLFHLLVVGSNEVSVRNSRKFLFLKKSVLFFPRFSVDFSSSDLVRNISDELDSSMKEIQIAILVAVDMKHTKSKQRKKKNISDLIKRLGFFSFFFFRFDSRREITKIFKRE